MLVHAGVRVSVITDKEMPDPRQRVMSLEQKCFDYIYFSFLSLTFNRIQLVRSLRYIEGRVNSVQMCAILASIRDICV